MPIHRMASLFLILLLNLILGFIYLEPFKMTATQWSVSSNDTEIFTKNSLLIKAEKNNGNIFNKAFTDIVLPEITSTFSTHFKFLINPQDLCFRGTKLKAKLSLLILVCTALPNTKEREAIRATWGSVANNNTDYLRLAFLLGSTRNESLQKAIVDESTKYADIIQQDFIDSYQNLTLKSIMLLKWVSEYCPNVQYVLKTDDDMYVNVHNLVNTLVRLPVKSNVIYGVLFRKAKPNRDPSAKWFVPKSQFDNETFPDYVSGTAYVMSRDVTPKLLEASAIIPFVVMEDVFITGLCASQSNVTRHNVKGFTYSKRPATGCAFKDDITGHHVTATDMHKIWRELHKKPLQCRVIKKKT